ncbi:hypothetical protein [Georgenia sp. SUBG003]|uniref:hypothetical protein n=1 Tax=Georgenia sp. SUBG003 TaxID=1497974 RepID=UPI003AB4D725
MTDRARAGLEGGGGERADAGVECADTAAEPTGLPAGAFAPVRLATAGVVGVLAAAGLWGQPWPVVVAGAGLAALGLLLTVIDVQTHRLPDKLVGPGAVWLLVMLALAAVLDGDLAAFGRVVLAGVASALGYLVLGLIRAGGPRSRRREAGRGARAVARMVRMVDGARRPRARVRPGRALRMRAPARPPRGAGVRVRLRALDDPRRGTGHGRGGQ